MQNYTLKVPFSLQQANNILEQIQLNKKGRIRNHTTSSLHFQGLASNLDISEWAMLQKNIKLGHWIQKLHPLKKKLKMTPNFCF